MISEVASALNYSLVKLLLILKITQREYIIMKSSIGKKLRLSSIAALILVSTQTFSFDLKKGHILLEGGANFSTQGKAQNIYINSLLGDRFSVTKRNDSNGLFGLGFLVDGPQHHLFDFAYGVNAFYLPNTSVQGTITQEFLFTNLAYRYNVTNVPIYASIKASTNHFSDKYAVTVDAGIGPNFKFSTYHDWSLDNGFTFPDRAFLSGTSTTFSATGGIGLKVNNAIGTVPVEVGYRFFYLGSGQLQRRTNQILNNLKTGNTYSQAVVVTVII